MTPWYLIVAVMLGMAIYAVLVWVSATRCLMDLPRWRPWTDLRRWWRRGQWRWR